MESYRPTNSSQSDNQNDFFWAIIDQLVVMASETGINLEEVEKFAEALGSDSGKEGAEFLKMIQIGPTTGNPVYNERYAEDLLLLIKQKCPDGRVSGLTSIREQRKYTAISGEIIKINGNCLRKRNS